MRFFTPYFFFIQIPQQKVHMLKIAEVKLSSCRFKVADFRKKLRLQNCGVAVAEQHFLISCGNAIAEVLPSSCACPPLGIRDRITCTKDMVRKGGNYNDVWHLSAVRRRPTAPIRADDSLGLHQSENVFPSYPRCRQFISLGNAAHYNPLKTP